MALTTDDYILKLGSSTKIPNKYIAKDSYKADHNLLVAKSFRNANGSTFENYYPNKQLLVTFQTSALTKSMFDTFKGYFTDNMITGTNDVLVSAWVPQEGLYVSQRCKVTGLSPVLDRESTRHDGIYNPMTITLTGYARSE